MQPRYFIGIKPPADIIAAIRAVQEQYFDPNILVEPLEPHITIIHPNALQTLAPSYFLNKVRQSSAPLLPVNLNLSGFGLFNKSILHFTVSSAELVKIEAQLRSLLPPDILAQYYVGRDYVPHITIAQTRPRNIFPEELELAYKSSLASSMGKSFTANEIMAYTQKGPRVYQAKSI